MLRVLAIAVLVLTVGCSKKADKPAKAKEAPVTAGTVQDGVRRIEVDAGPDGYTPARIAAKAGEKLVLVFKKTGEGCQNEVKTPDGKVVALETGKPVEVPVTVPETGEVTFACTMDMFRTVVVVEPS
jgi:plastocyanin domain-containing protein